MTIAQSLSFDEAMRSDIGIVATEMATNILLHAQSGEFLICPTAEHDGASFDLLALDTGSGIADLGRALEDGFSTIGTAGQGFGAIERLSDSASVYSLPNRGTAVWARFTKPRKIDTPRIGAVSIPVRGETVCGDAYLILPGKSRSLYMIADGLGHGPGAQEAAEEAVAVTKRYSVETPVEILTRAHDALKKTRGAAMSVAIVDHERMAITYGGIGNISAALITGTGSRSLVSQNGTLGASFSRAQEFIYPYESNSSLLMFSDGLTSRCTLSGYAGLQKRHPQLISGVLYRDFTRRRDDATVLFACLGSDSR
jgi:anti-sigma regulatory factor (Ser/Thr protein kinase)